MKNTTRHPLNATQRDALEARVALRITSHLETGAQQVPHDISQRLRVARQMAVAQAKASKSANVQIQIANAGLVQSGLRLAGGSLSGWSAALARSQNHGKQLDDAPVGWGWKLASFLPVVALVAGLWGIHAWYKHEQAAAAADVDIALLADELPPDAYADPGFEEFLNSTDTNETAPHPEADLEGDSAAEHETT